MWPMRKKKTLKLKFFLWDSISLQDCDEFVHFLIITIIFISSPIINQAPPREKPLNQKRPPAVALMFKNNDDVIMTKVATLVSNTVSASAQ